MSVEGAVQMLRGAGCVFAEDEARLLAGASRTSTELAALLARRCAGAPLEHLLGWADFDGLRIAVEPGVFVPRRRTELLVRTAVPLAPPRAVVVDLCCGSGAVGAALLARLEGAELHAVDVDPAAARCAARNLAPVGGRVHTGDLYGPLPAGLRGRVDVLVANAPYVPSEEIRLLPGEARLHEPAIALDGGSDGLDVLRRVSAGAMEWLAPAGCLLMETSRRQAPQAVEAFTRDGLRARVTACDELDATVVIATRRR